MGRARAGVPALTLALACALTIAGCASAISGTGVAGTPTTPTTGPTTGPPPTGTSGGFPSTDVPSSGVTTSDVPSTDTPTSVAAPRFTADELSLLLLPRPAGAQGWTSEWGRNPRPSLAQFVAAEYPAASRAAVTTQLVSQGLTAIAHRTWYAPDANQADDVLLLFASDDGAESRFRGASQAQAGNTGVKTLDLHEVPGVRAYYRTTLDKLGYIEVITYARVDNIVFEMFYYSLGSIKKNDLIAWERGQLRRMA